SVRHSSAAAADLGVAPGDGSDAGHGTGHEVALSLAPAPQDLGTEATLRLDLPVPGLAAGALAFTLLYRLRALLQTGEVPPPPPPPAARAAEH
ncbi:MAG: hypothetical protein AVDCRST_MAG35-35, partial [uncultured Quadrisphaera sp.]